MHQKKKQQSPLDGSSRLADIKVPVPDFSYSFRAYGLSNVSDHIAKHIVANHFAYVIRILSSNYCLSFQKAIIICIFDLIAGSWANLHFMH